MGIGYLGFDAATWGIRMDQKVTITIHNLGRLESRELERMLGSQVELQESREVSAGQQGDPSLFNLIASATPWVAGVVGLWLLKPRRGKTTVRKLTRVDESGRRTRRKCCSMSVLRTPQATQL